MSPCQAHMPRLAQIMRRSRRWLCGLLVPCACGLNLGRARCVDDPTAAGAYIDGAYVLSGRSCVYGAEMDSSMSRCALRNQHVVLIGDSTMRQLFGSLACKLDGVFPRHAPRDLPAQSDTSRPVHWVHYKTFPGSNACELEQTANKGSVRRDVLRTTWHVPDSNITLSFRWAEDATDLGKWWHLHSQRLSPTRKC